MQRTPSEVMAELATKEKMLVLYQDYHGIVNSADGSHSIRVQVFMAEDGVMYFTLEDEVNEEEEEALLAKSLVEMAEIRETFERHNPCPCEPCIFARAAVQDVA